MKKKVCIIHKVQKLDPRSFYKEGRSSAKAGYETIVIGLYGKNEKVHGIRLIGFRFFRKRLARFLISNYYIFREALRERADIYHFHDLDFIPWAILLKGLTRAKVIYDIHEAYPEYMLLKTYIPCFLRSLFFVLIYMMEHTAVKFFDAIVPNDNYVAKDFKHKNNVVIFNFPTLDFFKNKQDLPYQVREYDLFYHGSLPKYLFEAMMNIAEKLNSDNLRNIWGIATNDEATIAWAKQELKKRDLEGNFIFLPYADYLMVCEYLAKAKIGIIPLPPYKKFMKNLPLKMFEFMGCGLPIVLSDLPPSRQFINGKDCAIAVPPNSDEEYVKAIKLLLNDPERSITMGYNGKRLVLEKYNWNEEEKKLLKLYNCLTETHKKER
jgi:glycosyltransferase involved in cell wall biosynthesis